MEATINPLFSSELEEMKNNYLADLPEGDLPEDDLPFEEETLADEAGEAGEEETPAESAKPSEKKEEAPSPYEQVILAEMMKRAQSDTQIAQGLKSADKSIKECFRYVTECARKEAKGGKCAMVEDNKVYGWAVHYYTESKETIDAELKPAKKDKPEKKASKPSAKPATSTAKPSAPSPADKAEQERKARQEQIRKALLSSVSTGKVSTFVNTDEHGNRTTTTIKAGKEYKITELSLF